MGIVRPDLRFLPARRILCRLIGPVKLSRRRDMKLLPGKIARYGIFALLAGAYFVYLFFAFAQVPIDSDWASLNLEASDLLRGNFFLSGWNFTGATFLFTELPLYLSGAAFFGVSVRGVIFSIAFGGWLLFLAGFFLLREGLADGSFWQTLFFYAALCAVPALPALQNLRAHVGAYIIFMILIAVLFRLTAEKARMPKRWLAVYCILLVLTAASDLFIATLFVAPLIVYFGWGLVANEPSETTRRDVRLIGWTACAFFVGKALEKIYVMIGATPLNSRVGSAKWAGEAAVSFYFRNFRFGCMKLFGAYFGETRVFSIGTPAAWLKLILLLIGAAVIALNLFRFFRREKTTDEISAFLSLAIVCHGAWVVLGGFALNSENTLRYYAFFPYALAVLLIRTAFVSGFLSRRLVRSRLTVRTLSVAVCVLILALTFRLPPRTRVITPQDRLATFLRDAGYLSGYGDFWTATHTVVSSEDRIAVRAIRADEGSSGEVRRYFWFNRTDWYDDPEANFIVVGLKEPWMNVSEEAVRNFFGAPVRETRFEDYLILEYPKGLYSRFSQ